MDRRHDALGLLQRQLHDGSRVIVSRYGGQVLSWIADGRERLYLSERAAVDGRRPVRGGVPICFPQFSNRGSLPKHGIARTRRWSEPTSEADRTISLQLVEDMESLRLWPHRFALDLRVELLPRTLVMRIEVRNTGSEPWSFTAALHSYLRVEDVAATRLIGLRGRRVEDTLRQASSTLAGDTPDLSGPIDSIYHEIDKPLELHTPDGRLRIEQTGFADAVVWNPGADGAARIDDIEPGDANHFLCVEAAQVEQPVALEPGQSWTGSQVLRIL